jgi:hypothetical protein
MKHTTTPTLKVTTRGLAVTGGTYDNTTEMTTKVSDATSAGTTKFSGETTKQTIVPTSNLTSRFSDAATDVSMATYRVTPATMHKSVEAVEVSSKATGNSTLKTSKGSDDALAATTKLTSYDDSEAALDPVVADQLLSESFSRDGAVLRFYADYFATDTEHLALVIRSKVPENISPIQMGNILKYVRPHFPRT